MPRMKPTRTMRIGMMLGAGGFMVVVVTAGLWFADIGGRVMPTIINGGATVAALGAIVLAAGGIWYVRRHRDVVGRRRGEIEKMAPDSSDAPAEEAELPPEKRRGAREARENGDAPGAAAQPADVEGADTAASQESVSQQAKNPPLAKSFTDGNARPEAQPEAASG